MTPFLAYALGLVSGLVVAGCFLTLGYRLARLHEQQTGESNILSSRESQ